MDDNPVQTFASSFWLLVFFQNIIPSSARARYQTGLAMLVTVHNVIKNCTRGIFSTFHS